MAQVRKTSFQLQMYSTVSVTPGFGHQAAQDKKPWFTSFFAEIHCNIPSALYKTDNYYQPGLPECDIYQAPLPRQNDYLQMWS